MFRMKMEKLPELLLFLSMQAELYIPVEMQGATLFKKFEKGDKPFLGKGNTDYSTKQLFFPYKEVMFKYDREGNIEKMPAPPERIVFGIRPCDLHAIKVADAFFSDSPADPYYLEKRKRTTLIALDCAIPGKNCFCDSLGTREAVGHDILIFPEGKFYYASEGTEKGKKLIEKSGLFEKTSEVPNFKKLPCKKRADPVDSSKVKWGKWGGMCFACSACTSVCPTCTCFAVEDEKQFAGKTERQRIWASCFTKDFTQMAGGHCFRGTKAEMLKQFVSHKFPYFKDKFGVAMCVGCGRCISACTAKIDISKMISGK